MAKKRQKFIKTVLPPVSDKIRPPLRPIDKLLCFSFKYLDLNNELFSIANVTNGYWYKFLGRLKNLSSWTAKRFLMDRTKALRTHPIDWSNTRINGFGIPGRGDLDEIAYQFSITKESHGRVHGQICLNKDS